MQRLGRTLDEPGVVRVGAHVKLVRRREFEWSLVEAFQDGLRVFGHVELWRTEGKVLQHPLLVVVTKRPTDE